ncbi:MAG: hypothetical protein J0G95_16965 [Rhizobiales bacterium]|nr:hypothetical protein [Hyphomicrobiales bacterium]
MKFLTLACGVAASLLLLMPPADAAPKKSREECLALAKSRGFNGGGTRGGAERGEFVKACMQGKN